MSGDVIEAEGVVESWQHDVATVFVELAGARRRILAKRCGRMATARVFVLPGDRVKVEVSPYDLTRGRITVRYDGRKPRP